MSIYSIAASRCNSCTTAGVPAVEPKLVIDLNVAEINDWAEETAKRLAFFKANGVRQETEIQARPHMKAMRENLYAILNA
jgi:hypothetical protein